MTLPKFLQPCFPSYNLNSLDKTWDKKLIITQILNFGTEKDLIWLGKNYSQKEIKEIILNPTRGMWMSSILSYWLKIFDLKLDNQVFNQAIINLNNI